MKRLYLFALFLLPSARQTVQINDFHENQIPKQPPIIHNQDVPDFRDNLDASNRRLPKKPAVVDQMEDQNQRKHMDSSESHIIHYDECKADIAKYCYVAGTNPQDDMTILECLLNTGQSESEQLVLSCENLVWQFKVNLTSDVRFKKASLQFCEREMQSNKELKQCIDEKKPGFMLSCLLENMEGVKPNTQCHKFLDKTKKLAFSDFRLVGPFVQACSADVQKFKCGSLADPNAMAQKVPHSQGATLECLIEKMVEASQKQKTGLSIIDSECHKQMMRIAELQSEDFHMDRPLFFACREDREIFCKAITSGEGRIFQCLLEHHNDEQMTGKCSKILNERAQLMGQNYRLSHPLLQGCASELQQYGCSPRSDDRIPEHVHLSWVVLCLENAIHSKRSMGVDCKNQMIAHRRMLLDEFQLNPNVVLECGQDITTHCGDPVELRKNTIHCLMNRVTNGLQPPLASRCVQALETVVKVADVASNYKVDRVLYASCRNLIDDKCALDAESDMATFTCLTDHMDDSDMTDLCEQRLLEIQYFMARSWSLDPRLYGACRRDAVEKCHAVDDWHRDQSNNQQTVNPGPLVLACLYRAAYDENDRLQTECAKNVRRVLHTRAIRVKLMPQVEENCRQALSEYCSHNVQPGEEMLCLQENFELDEFQSKYAQCYKQVVQFTAFESVDIKLNRALTKACRPVIRTHCDDFMDEDIDNGDVMECLQENKDAPEMNGKCLSFVSHLELISMRDYQFSPKLVKACKSDIEMHCKEHGDNKADIVRCLSTVLFKHRILETTPELTNDCKKQLKRAYLEQEQFDDTAPGHIESVDPDLFSKCRSNIDGLGCRKAKLFEDIIECLRSQSDHLTPDCKAAVFEREEIEAADNEFDDELQKWCKLDIEKFCSGYEPQQVLTCLTMSKVARQLKPKCQQIVTERMHEQVKDDRLNPNLLEACRVEITTHCPRELDKLNQPRYAQHGLEAIVLSCLRRKFANRDPTRRSIYSPQCESEVMRMILEAEFDIQSDPALFDACKQTMTQHCVKDVLMKDGSVLTVLDCLKADYYHGSISDLRCQQELARRTEESMVDIHLDPMLYQACSLDIKHLCPEIRSGGSRIISCLVDALQSTSAQITKSCRIQLTERDKLWQKAHKDFQVVLPENLAEIAQLVADSPSRNNALTVFVLLVCVLFIIGCCCGRLTKRVKREMKNK